ncbi:helix-turn-helix domain-containing protein [Streptomyces sp. NPDC087525]|uniref:helix-turn-helix domain-containing protein n=1 Tax=Streptomyces sp. NPDC087525 TaxID=3365793 RepID=UPI00380C2435
MTAITATAAATLAGVTVATIRTWCRRNVIGAVKTSGRWVIDRVSLAHRLSMGASRQPRTSATPITEHHAMTFTPYTQVRLYRDSEGHHLRVVHHPDAMSSGNELLHLEMHYQDGSVVHTRDVASDSPCTWATAVAHTEPYTVDLNTADAETALRDTGWEITGPWARSRAGLSAPVQRRS